MKETMSAKMVLFFVIMQCVGNFVQNQRIREIESRLEHIKAPPAGDNAAPLTTHTLFYAVKPDNWGVDDDPSGNFWSRMPDELAPSITVGDRIRIDLNHSNLDLSTVTVNGKVVNP